MIYLLGNWYTHQELGTRTAIFTAGHHCMYIYILPLSDSMPAGLLIFAYDVIVSVKYHRHPIQFTARAFQLMIVIT